MKLNPIVSLAVLTAGMSVLGWKGNAQSVDEQIQVARTALNADRKATVAEVMQFTEAEGKAFWPLYEQYRAEMAKQGDALLKLVKEYGQLYPNVSDERARVMLKEIGDIERERVQVRSSYLKKIAKVVSPSKTLRSARTWTSASGRSVTKWSSGSPKRLRSPSASRKGEMPHEKDTHLAVNIHGPHRLSLSVVAGPDRRADHRPAQRQESFRL